MSLTKITSTVINTLSSFFSINSSTGAITTNVPDLIGSNTTLYPSFACRAWVNFDGTKDTTGASSTSNTNRLIRGSGNVTSVLRNGTGDYTITFTTAMPDANYILIGSGQVNSGYGDSSALVRIGVKATGNVRISVADVPQTTLQDVVRNDIIILR